ncbi:hypothetical protein VULLAG_LOCUS11696 [Vulpes lagopus]
MEDDLFSCCRPSLPCSCCQPPSELSRAESSHAVKRSIFSLQMHGTPPEGVLGYPRLGEQETLGIAREKTSPSSPRCSGLLWFIVLLDDGQIKLERVKELCRYTGLVNFGEETDLDVDIMLNRSV